MIKVHQQKQNQKKKRNFYCFEAVYTSNEDSIKENLLKLRKIYIYIIE